MNCCWSGKKRKENVITQIKKLENKGDRPDRVVRAVFYGETYAVKVLVTVSQPSALMVTVISPLPVGRTAAMTWPNLVL